MAWRHGENLGSLTEISRGEGTPLLGLQVQKRMQQWQHKREASAACSRMQRWARIAWDREPGKGPCGVVSGARDRRKACRPSSSAAAWPAALPRPGPPISTADTAASNRSSRRIGACICHLVYCPTSSDKWSCSNTKVRRLIQQSY